jgi:Fis family transcriptional regulator
LEYTKNNQSKAAEILGLNRGTLRKKLKQYDLL